MRKHLSSKEKIGTLTDLAQVYAGYIHQEHLKQFPKTEVKTCPHQDCVRAAKIFERVKSSRE